MWVEILYHQMSTSSYEIGGAKEYQCAGGKMDSEGRYAQVYSSGTRHGRNWKRGRRKNSHHRKGRE